MRGLDSIRMTSHLNALCPPPGGATPRVDPETAAAAIVGTDVAHHVVDPDGVLGLDPWRATEFAEALSTLLAAEPRGWILALPLPGARGALRGPRPLNEAALEVGEVVVGVSAGLALVAYRVGPAVQWRIFRAEPPRPLETPRQADRALRERVLSTGTQLARLDVSGGVRPPAVVELPLPRHFDARQRETADRAGRLVAVCNAALSTDGASITSYEATARAVELRGLREAAIAALCAAVSWTPREQVVRGDPASSRANP